MAAHDDVLFAPRHSAAHILAMAILELFPDARLGTGPVVDNGFYYDVNTTHPITEADLPRIEKAMRRIIARKPAFTREELSLDDARALFAGLGQTFKLELIDKRAAEGATTVSIYRTGDFADLCEGPHVTTAAEIPADGLEVTKLAGAYWQADETRDRMTRVYGLLFASADDLAAYHTQMAEAAKRDHRLLGERLDLFTFDESIGKGLPLWLPNGTIVKEELENWAKQTEAAWGYQRVTTPIITKENLFYTSGHLPLYRDSMYAPIVIEDENYYIKPMNCPFHHKVYAARPRSYRELPLRLAEYGWCHRYEDSGSLFGLMRVRGMQMNDAHIYVPLEEAVDEFVRVIKLHEYYYKALGITEYMMELALRDGANMTKYHGSEEDWQLAEKMTIEAMERSGVPYTVVNEGAAFYGPKMDFQITSSIGRQFTASTNQLDLYMGKKFGLEYVDRDGTRKTPAIIHRAPLGTHERFIGFLIEHFAGAFPVWLSPVQLVVLPIGEAHRAAAQNIVDAARTRGIRAELADENDSLGKRIREAKMRKVPYLAVIGDAEVAAQTVALEHRDAGKIGAVAADAALVRIADDIATKRIS